MPNYHPTQVIPHVLASAIAELSYWFVIGGHAVRCFCPYRPSRDVDFGVHHAKDMKDFISQLEKKGTVEILERSKDTTHLRFNGINVSVFVLENFKPFVKEQRLTVTGILATKLHAILDRGMRRDFFDLYVTLHKHRLGIAECLSALHKVYQQPINEALLLRALTYFDDAEREMPLPGEGLNDWKAVKEFFLARVGNLIIPPSTPLEIQQHVVGCALNLE